MSFFNKKIWSRKFLASLLVVALFISALVFNVLLPPKPAKAGDATTAMQVVQWIQQIVAWAKDYSNQQKQKSYQKTTSQIQEWFKSDTLDRRSERESWNETRKNMLDEMVNNILGNIQDIGNGQAAFVTDWKDFLTGQTDQYFQNFVSNDLNQAAICDTFKSEIQQELSSGNEPSYSAQAECPLQDAEAMKNGTSQDFWAGWMNIIRPSGNPFGSFMIADDQKIEQEALGFTAEYGKLIANQGNQGTPDTPGILQSYAAQRASMMDLDYLLNSADLETYFGSVVDSFINQITKQGLSKFDTSAARPITNYPPTVSPKTADLDFIKTNYNYALLISDQLALTREDLQALQDAGGPADAQIAQADQAIDDNKNLVTAMEQAMAAEGTGDSTQINATIANAKNAHNTSLSSLQALLGTSEIWLQKISPLIDTYDSQIVDQTNQLICLRSPGGCL